VIGVLFLYLVRREIAHRPEDLETDGQKQNEETITAGTEAHLV
jgi:hypothetical protein